MRERLNEIPLFQGLGEEQLAMLSAEARERELTAGDVLFHEGEPPSELFVLVEGELQVLKRAGHQDVVIGIMQAGAFTGEVAVLTNTPQGVTVRALGPACVLSFPGALLRHGIDANPLIGLLLSELAERVRNREAMVHQHDKLAALGRLSAGLSHELNNPVSAAQRAADGLPAGLARRLALGRRLVRHGVTDEQLARLNEYAGRLAAERQERIFDDPLAQSDREQRLLAWLEAHAINEPWRLAPALADAGLDVAGLDELRNNVTPPALDDVLCWLEASLTLDEQIDVVRDSMARISELVTAVKAYSYVDRTPVQEIDVHEGIENTLRMLRHKLEGIEVLREYDRSIPRITAYASELNQVWTNLIDNAADAMKGNGRLWIRTSGEGDQVIVEIADSGPGIPADLQARIFEPFVTTKGIGEGTGLGLNIAYRIVVERHGGDLRLSTSLGNTCFEVRLPTTPQAGTPLGMEERDQLMEARG